MGSSTQRYLLVVGCASPPVGILARTSSYNAMCRGVLHDGLYQAGPSLDCCVQLNRNVYDERQAQKIAIRGANDAASVQCSGSMSFCDHFVQLLYGALSTESRRQSKA